MTPTTHTALVQAGMLAGEHFVDRGYVNAKLLATSAGSHSVELADPIRHDITWQGKADEGFAIDWDAHTAVQGHRSVRWKPHRQQRPGDSTGRPTCSSIATTAPSAQYGRSAPARRPSHAKLALAPREWLGRLPHSYDLPGFDIELTGVNVTTRDPLTDTPGAQAVTGAFAPFGTATRPGQKIAAALPCSAAVMRCDLDGGNLELVAWGLRNAFGLGFLPDGRLLAVDQGADDRGSRPIGDAPDLLFEVREGAWYGWPDFIGGIPVTDAKFKPQRGPQPTFLLANHDQLPPPEQAVLDFEAHVAATKFAVTPPGSPSAGQLVITLFGDEAPMTLPPGGPKLGRHLLMVDPDGWSIRGLPSEPDLHRPIDVGFAPGDPALYVLDFGEFEMTDHGVEAKAGTGRLLRWEGWDQPATTND